MTENRVTDAIVTRGLVRQFGAVRAVDGVDLAVHRGEIYGFLGPNGAGKTTVIRMLITLLAPTSGAITVAGYDAVAQPDQVRLRIGAALQAAALDDKQTGKELLTLQGRLYGLRGPEIAARMADLTDLINIGDAMGRLIGTYSGGMKRRLDLAAALIIGLKSCSSTNPPRALIPSAATAYLKRLGRSIPTWVLPFSLPPSTWKRPTPWPTGWVSSTGAGWPPREPRGTETLQRVRPDNRQAGWRRFSPGCSFPGNPGFGGRGGRSRLGINRQHRQRRRAGQRGRP